jgi:aspartyl protease family protein
VRFLVDTGASAILLTAADAARVGAQDSGEGHWIADTANGKSAMRRIRLDTMSVGVSRAEDVPAAIGSDGLSVSLLGANWIAHVSSMTIEGDRMLLR